MRIDFIVGCRSDCSRGGASTSRGLFVNSAFMSLMQDQMAQIKNAARNTEDRWNAH